MSVPKNFDWRYYLSSHPDLNKFLIKTPEKAQAHWIKYGYKEGRKYYENQNLWEILYPINPVYYKNKYHHLRNLSTTELILHWFNEGAREGYINSPQMEQSQSILRDQKFDWIFYTQYNKDLSHFTEIEAIKHYIQHGYKEKRSCSPSHQDLLVEVNNQETTKVSSLLSSIQEDNQETTKVSSLLSLIQEKEDEIPLKCAVIVFHKNIRNIFREEWITQCVKSIYSQTYRDFDIFEVNYGNDSYSVTFTKFFYQKDFPDHTYAMNYLINKVFKKGYDVVFNVNLDDYYAPERFERELLYIRKGYDLVSCYFNHINEKGEIVCKINDEALFQRKIIGLPSQEAIRNQLESNNNIICHSGLCLSKKFWMSYDNNGNLLRYADNKPFEDLSLWKRGRTNPDLKFAIVPEYLVYYRRHEKQICSRDMSNISYYKELPKKRIGILLVATGKYKKFLPNVIKEIFSNFLPIYPKLFFLFIDSVEDLDYLASYPHILTIINRRGFPGDTLYRYNYFLLRKDDIIQKTDVVYYFDVDMGIPEIIGEEVFPTSENPLIGTRHPGFNMKHPFQNPSGALSEISTESMAYVSPDKRIHNYIAGGFNGGISHYFIKMAKEIKKNIKIDDDNEIIAVWHDESHLNCYYNNHPDIFKILPSDYCFPENIDLSIPLQPRIVALSKNHDFYRSSERYIGCKFRGGLGNLLFQVATTLSLSLDNDLIPVFDLTNSEGRKKTYRGNILFKIMRIKYDKLKFTEIKEENFSYNPISLVSQGNILLIGYFQSWKYFHHHRQEIIKKLDMKNKVADKIYQEIISKYNENTVSIHFRRTDYLKLSDYHHNLSLKYYEKAMAIFPTDYTFIVFSDDIEYCQGLEILKKLSNVYFVIGLQDYQDFILMSKCRNHIIANSTFSWWAAYISGGRVIYPRQWFGMRGPQVIWEDLVLPEWEGIDD